MLTLVLLHILQSEDGCGEVSYLIHLFSNSYYCIPNQWIVFFACSDWLLKLGMVSAVLPAERKFFVAHCIFCY